VEGSESPKQKTTKWQPGSVQAQSGITSNYKEIFSQKFLWLPVNYSPQWGCQH
jgi:hypothetical protein